MLGPVFINFDKSSYRTVIGSFDIIRKQASWKLVHAPVILETFAADAFAAAWFPGAVAFLLIFFAVAFFHARLPQW